MIFSSSPLLVCRKKEKKGSILSMHVNRLPKKGKKRAQRMEKPKKEKTNKKMKRKKKEWQKRTIVTIDGGKKEIDSSNSVLCVPLLLWFDVFKTFEILSFLHRSELFSFFRIEPPACQPLYQQWSTSIWKIHVITMRNKTTKIYKMKWQMNSNRE